MNVGVCVCVCVCVCMCEGGGEDGVSTREMIIYRERISVKTEIRFAKSKRRKPTQGATGE